MHLTVAGPRARCAAAPSAPLPAAVILLIIKLQEFGGRVCAVSLFFAVGPGRLVHSGPKRAPRTCRCFPCGNRPLPRHDQNTPVSGAGTAFWCAPQITRHRPM